jgi:O-antigen/teichoic acid export membrane protein
MASAEPATAALATAPAARPSRRGQVVRGFVAIVCGQGIRTIGHLLLVPLFLRYWSVAAYGEWLALASLTQYLSTCDFGMNTAGTNRLTQEYARGDLGAYTRYQASAFAFYAVVAGGGSLLLAVAVWQLPVPRWLGLQVIPADQAAWVAWLLGLQILWAMPVGFLSSIYRTTGRLAWSVWLGNARHLAAVALVPVVLGLGGGMPALAGFNLIPLAATAAFVLWHTSRRWPKLWPRPTQARAWALSELMAPSLFFALLTLASALTLQGAVLLVATQLGGVAVAVFVTSRTLTSLIRQVVFTVNNSLWPHLTAMEATGDYGRLRLIHRLIVLGSTALSIVCAAALWQVGPGVIDVWTGGKLMADVTLLRLLLVQVVLQAPWVASSVLPVASNRPQTVAVASAVSSVVGLAVAALLIGRYGVAAVPIGFIAGEALACYVFVPRQACRLVRDDFRRFAVRQWMSLGVGVAFAFPAAWAAAQIASGPRVLQWVEIGAAALAASIVAVLISGLDSGERRLLLRKSRASLVRLGVLAALRA